MRLSNHLSGVVARSSSCCRQEHGRALGGAAGARAPSQGRRPSGGGGDPRARSSSGRANGLAALNPTSATTTLPRGAGRSIFSRSLVPPRLGVRAAATATDDEEAVAQLREEVARQGLVVKETKDKAKTLGENPNAYAKDEIAKLLQLKSMLDELTGDAKDPPTKAVASSGGSGKKQKKGKAAAEGAAASSSSLEELKKVRIDKASALREIAQGTQAPTSSGGFMPFAYRFDRSHYCRELQESHADLGAGEDSSLVDQVAVCGRVTNKRIFGKLAFITIEDVTGTIQLQISKKNLPPRPSAPQEGEEGSDGDAFGSLSFGEMKKLLDLGDIVGGCGSVRKTDKGELSVNCANFVVLTKALVPLPDKYHGLKDQEMRYRRREVDLLAGGPTGLARRALVARASVMRAMRDYLHHQRYTEVETPVLHKQAGGADARPFTTHHNALDKGLTLRIATELHLKRLVVGGLERVYEIGKVFRNEGVSTRHNPEFTSIEVYQAYADYNDMMTLTEDLIRSGARAVLGLDGAESEVEDLLGRMPYQGQELNLRDPFARITMSGSVLDKTGVDPFQLGETEAGEALAEAVVSALRAEGKVAVGESEEGEIRAACASSAGHALACLFELYVEETLVQPTFVIDLPLAISPLAKPHRIHPDKFAERFELFVCGRELANAFSELTDPLDQRERFERQVASHVTQRAAMEKTMASKDQLEEMDYEIEIDEEFISALEYGMPPTAGMGLGIDRLIMMLVDAPSIRDVIGFPLLK